MASRLSVRGPSRTLIPEQQHSNSLSFSLCAFNLGAPSSKPHSLDFTCHLATIGHPYCTEAVVGNGCDLASTPRPVVVVAAGVWVRHGVWVVGVEVVTTLWTLGGKNQYTVEYLLDS